MQKNAKTVYKRAMGWPYSAYLLHIRPSVWSLELKKRRQNCRKAKNEILLDVLRPSKKTNYSRIF